MGRMRHMPRSLDDCLAQIDRGVAFHRECMNDQPQINTPYAQPLLDAVALFNELGIGYALIGGVAAMNYGRARFTDDVDFVAVSGHMTVLEQHGDAMQRHHFDRSCTWKLYHSSGIEIDIWKDQFSDDIVRRAQTVTLAGQPIRIAERHDLIAMKLRANRIQDDYDISEMVKAGGVDESQLTKLVTSAEMNHFYAVASRTRQ